MASEKQFEVTILLPTTYSTQRDGTIDQTSEVDYLVKQICKVTGGVSSWLQQGTELWDDGTVYDDVSLRVVTTTRHETDVETLRSIAICAIDMLRQRGGIFFQVHEVVTQWLSREDNEYTASCNHYSQASDNDLVYELNAEQEYDES